MDFWDYGKTHCMRMYQRIVWGKLSNEIKSWADDPAVWLEVIEESKCWEVIDPLDWCEVADFLNHYDKRETQTLFKLADWMCGHWKATHLTWRLLKEKLDELPDDLLDERVYLDVPYDSDLQEGSLAFVDGIEPWYEDKPADRSLNPLALTIPGKEHRDW